MVETDLEYYERRIANETMLSDTASSPEAASAHRALAVIYAEEVRRMRASVASLNVAYPAQPRRG